MNGHFGLPPHHVTLDLCPLIKQRKLDLESHAGTQVRHGVGGIMTHCGAWCGFGGNGRFGAFSAAPLPVGWAESTLESLRLSIPGHLRHFSALWKRQQELQLLPMLHA